MVNKYKHALESLWDGACDIYVRETIVNPENGRNETDEKALYTQLPCRLSYKSISSTNEESEAAAVQQVVKLFIAKDIEIPSGSKIVVKQEGRAGTYTKSGDPAVYRFHQEVVLEHFKEYA